MTEQMTEHRIGTREEWLATREQLLVREKEHTRLGDELAQQRRELPWVRVEKEYRFDTDDGDKQLVELFDGRSQLLVYHFMFGPSYEAGCPTCSSMADGIDGLLPHLHARDGRSHLSHKHRWRSCRPTSAAWAGVFPGSPPRAQPSTSTWASRAARSRRATRSRRCSRRACRRSSSTTPTRRAPTSSVTSPSSSGSTRLGRAADDVGSNAAAPIARSVMARKQIQRVSGDRARISARATGTRAKSAVTMSFFRSNRSARTPATGDARAKPPV